MYEYKPGVIMVVEDDPADQKLIRNSFKTQKISNELIVMDSCEMALEYLQDAKDPTKENEMPDLILLDLNLPGMDGKEFLKRVKADDDLVTIPVVVLTTSDADNDVLDTFKLQASGYVKKPVDFMEFKEVIFDLGEYWFTVCKRVPHDNKCKQVN